MNYVVAWLPWLLDLYYGKMSLPLACTPHFLSEYMSEQQLVRNLSFFSDSLYNRLFQWKNLIISANFLNSCLAGSIFSVGEALLLFLEALPEPVIPYKFQSKCMDACQNYILCKQVTTICDSFCSMQKNRWYLKVLRLLGKDRVLSIAVYTLTFWEVRNFG